MFVIAKPSQQPPALNRLHISSKAWHQLSKIPDSEELLRWADGNCSDQAVEQLNHWMSNDPNGIKYAMNFIRETKSQYAEPAIPRAKPPELEASLEKFTPDPPHAIPNHTNPEPYELA